MSSGSTEHPDQTAIYPSRLVTAALLLLCFFGGLKGIMDLRSPDHLDVWLGWFLIAVCGGMALYTLQRLIRNRPSIVIDSTGITDHSSGLGAWHLRWHEVDRVIPCMIMGKTMLGIIPKDLDGFLKARGTIGRLFAKMNLQMGDAPAIIPQVAISMPLEELAALMHVRYGVLVGDDEP